MALNGRGGSSPLQRIEAPAVRGLFLCRLGYDSVVIDRVGEAGLVGLRGRLGRWVADETGKRTPLDADLLATLIGAYLFVSRSRRMVEMIRGLRRI